MEIHALMYPSILRSVELQKAVWCHCSAGHSPCPIVCSHLNPKVTVFGDHCILNEQVEKWPICDCLIAFYSTGFPSEKAKEYVKLRRPYALNNLEMEEVLHDRRRVRSESGLNL